MPYLKKKIAKAILKNSQIADDLNPVKVEYADEKQPIVKIEEPVPPKQTKTMAKPAPKKTSKNQKPTEEISASILQAKKTANSAKNIVKNFGRAMVTFAISKLAVPYIEAKLKELDLEYQVFQSYLFQRKENMDGISSLRALILIEDGDEEPIKAIKQAFQFTGEVFIKNFSLNWIYNSKLGDKLVHVKSRFKILRRIQNPQYFTYFKM
jgi:hypothetical protein